MQNIRIWCIALTVSITILLFILLLFPLSDAVIQNLLRVEIIKTWTGYTLVDSPVNNQLQDGIPDDWSIHVWGNSRWIVRLEQREDVVNDFVVYLKRTNNQGVVALTQEIPITSNTHILCSVYARGTNSALQLLFQSPDGEWVNGGWLDIDQDDWTFYYFTVIIPDGSRTALLRLRSSNSAWFSEAHCSLANDGKIGPNLLKNSTFEQDGSDEDPLEWWQANVFGSGILSTPNHNFSAQLSYLNIIDMMAGRYHLIRQRAQQLGDNCVYMPEMTNWLLVRSKEFGHMGGAVAKERLYQLAIELMPNCPHPYAALASLYQSTSAFWRAAELYHVASTVAGENTQAGRYAFEEGFIHVRYTGNFERAVPALQKAEQWSGWEGAQWYYGASSLFLGQALELQNNFEDAAEAYQRVLDCRPCSYHHGNARQRLSFLIADGRID